MSTRSLLVLLSVFALKNSPNCQCTRFQQEQIRSSIDFVTGCKNNPELCNENEFCFDDNLFGICSKIVTSSKSTERLNRQPRKSINRCIKHFDRNDWKIRFALCFRRSNWIDEKRENQFDFFKRKMTENNDENIRREKIDQDANSRNPTFNYLNLAKLKSSNEILSSNLITEEHESFLSTANQQRTTRKNLNQTRQTLDNIHFQLKDNNEHLLGYVIFNRNFKSQQEASDFTHLIIELNQWPENIFKLIRIGRKMLTYQISTNNLSILAENISKTIYDNKKIFEEKFHLEIIHAANGNSTEASRIISESSDGSRIVSIILIIFSLTLLLLIGFGLLCAIHNDESARHQSTNHSEVKKPRKYTNVTTLTSSTSKSQKMPESTKFNRGSPKIFISSSSGEISTEMKPDLTITKSILSYVNDQLENQVRFETSWKTLSKLTYEFNQHSTFIALSERNIMKNRHLDSIPYDHARVQLVDNDADDDYINASSIFDSDPKCKYIATQGPMPNTVESFWQMVWEQGSSIIVALARPIENGITMSHHYWPVEGSIRFSDFEIHLMSEHLWSEDFVVRSFYLRNLQKMETRTVTHFHFLTWEEFSNPRTAKALLDFRRQVKQARCNESSPIVVHCNDGTGRTGTLILIDMILNQIEKGIKEINIAATLEHIRNQRPRMIKRKEHYEFVFVAVAEEIKSTLK